MTPGQKAWAQAEKELADLSTIAKQQALREAVARAFTAAVIGNMTANEAADAAIAVALEQAAKVADYTPAAMVDSTDPYASKYIEVNKTIAAAIRALIPTASPDASS